MLAACARAPLPPQSRCAAPRAAAPLAAPPAASLRPRAAPGAIALHAVRGASLPQLRRAAPRRRALPASRRLAAAPRAAIKPITTFDPDNFTLEPEADAELRKLLGSATFCSQVAAERGWQPQAPDAPAVAFTGRLFTPAPWTPTTKMGMPADLEPLAKDTERYVFINVPYNFMFQCKISNPARLCAVFERAGSKAA